MRDNLWGTLFMVIGGVGFRVTFDPVTGVWETRKI